MPRYDVIVAGGGNAGLCAALSAREAGATVLLLERAPAWQRGGDSRHTRDIRYAHEEPDDWAPVAYPAEQFFLDLEAVGGTARRELADLMIAESVSLPRWMEHCGVRWQKAIAGTLQLHTNRFFLGGGKAMVNAYYRTAATRGVTIAYDTQVTRLDITRGRCTALHVKVGAKAESLTSRAVVVTAGGFQANHDWRVMHWGLGAKNFVVRGTPFNDGTLALSLLERGADTAGNRLFHGVAVDARSPRYDGGIVTRVDCIPFGVVLNKHGRRFYDEGEDAWPKRYAEWGQLIADQPDQTAYVVCDNQAAGLFIPPLFPPLSASSLGDLLDQLDIDRAVAFRTIKAFNAAIDTERPFNPSCLDGRHTRGVVPPRSNWARALSVPPFFAYPLHTGVTFSYAALAVDTAARVLYNNGREMANVFAAGEVMAGNLLTRGYLAGVGLTIGSVFGRIAGREAARV